MTQLLPFMSLIKNLYENDKIELICNQNKIDILASFVNDILCSIIRIACHYEEYEAYITEYYSFFFTVISELDISLFSQKDILLKAIKNIYNIDNEKKNFYSSIINNFLEFLTKEKEDDINDIKENVFINTLIESIINNHEYPYSQLYTKLMKDLFVFNQNWSNKDLFYDKNKSNNLSIKYKRLNYYTKNFQFPFIYPILEMDKYIPKFSNFDKKNLFKSNNYINYDFSLSKNNIIINSKKKILNENSKNMINNQFEKCCLVKQNYHIKGKIEISKKEGNKESFEIIFISNDKDVEYTCNKNLDKNEKDNGINFVSMNEKNKDICYGSLFKCPEKEYGKKIVIKSDDIILVLVREYYHRVSAIEIFTIKNKSYYFNFNEKFKINKKIFFLKKSKTLNEESNLHKKFTINSEKNIINNEESSIPNSTNKKEDNDNKINSINNDCGETDENNNDHKDEIKSEVKEAENLILSNLNTNHFKKIIIKNFLLGYYNEKYKQYMHPLFGSNCISNLSFKYYSNFDIIMLINIFSNRSFKDIYQYPVFPMLYDLINLKRNMSMHIGIQNINNLSEGRLNLINQNYTSSYEDYLESNGTMDPVHLFNTHYNNPIYTSNFLIRIFPHSLSCIELQGDGFDSPNRLFYSIEGMMNNSLSQKSDLRELIPEFFYFPVLFHNINDLSFEKLVDGKSIDTVILSPNKKPKEKDNYKVIFNMRQNLEKTKVNEWIDLIFGINQKKDKQKRMYFERESYVNFEKGDDILNDKIIMDATDFGLIPFQLFYKKFPEAQKENIESIKKYNNIMIDYEHFVNYSNPVTSCICLGRTNIEPEYLEVYNFKPKKEASYNYKKKIIELDEFCYYFIGDIFGNVTIYRVVNGIDSNNNSNNIKNQEKKLNVPKQIKKAKTLINNVISGIKTKIKKIKTKKKNNENEKYDSNVETKNEEDTKEENESETKDAETSIPEVEDNKIEEKDNKIEGEYNKDDKTVENMEKYYYAKVSRMCEKNIYKIELFNKMHAHNEQIRYIDFNGRLNLFLTYALDGFVNLYLFPSCKMINEIEISKVSGNAIFTKVLLISNPFPMFVCLNTSLIYVFDINGNCIYVEEIMDSEAKLYIDKNYGIIPDFITINGEEFSFPFIKSNEK